MLLAALRMINTEVFLKSSILKMKQKRILSSIFVASASFAQRTNDIRLQYNCRLTKQSLYVGATNS